MQHNYNKIQNLKGHMSYGGNEDCGDDYENHDDDYENHDDAYDNQHHLDFSESSKGGRWESLVVTMMI